MLRDTDNNDANAIDLAILIMKICRYMWKLRTMINLLIGFENLAETTPYLKILSTLVTKFILLNKMVSFAR